MSFQKVPKITVTADLILSESFEKQTKIPHGSIANNSCVALLKKVRLLKILQAEKMRNILNS